MQYLITCPFLYSCFIYSVKLSPTVLLNDENNNYILGRVYQRCQFEEELLGACSFSLTLPLHVYVPMMCACVRAGLRACGCVWVCVRVGACGCACVFVCVLCPLVHTILCIRVFGCLDTVDHCNATPKPCFNNATCTNYFYRAECNCAPGFTGASCIVNIDDCANSPCHRGVCIDGINDYTCR